jgi:hypothetical protein
MTTPLKRGNVQVYARNVIDETAGVCRRPRQCDRLEAQLILPLVEGRGRPVGMIGRRFPPVVECGNRSWRR